MCAGVAILLVYSRLYGMQTLWLAYAGEACSGLYSVKTLSEESTELLAYELRNALENLGEISGEFTNDEVLGNIFSKFCIGK